MAEIGTPNVAIIEGLSTGFKSLLNNFFII